MRLRDLNLNISYGPTDDRLSSFFIPAMATSVRYERGPGYFSSSMLAVAVKQEEERGGRKGSPLIMLD